MDDEEHFADDEMEIEVQTPVIKKKKIRVRKSKKKSVENQFRGQSVRLRDNSKTDNVSNMEGNQNLNDYALPYLSYQKNDGMGTRKRMN
ncbi:Glutamyl-tRNA(Gln) amidotransferase subunit [Trichinella spiralis]|uniref:Glutamyl-tRNA(Gln) amidotransferase subunit n=1 Tax=Trichinella spiralis TaxID=6334 RepID=A0ABR3KD74_TRISP